MFLLFYLVAFCLVIFFDIAGQLYGAPYKGMKFSQMMEQLSASSNPTVQTTSGTIVEQPHLLGVEGIFVPMLLFICATVFLALLFKSVKSYQLKKEVAEQQSLLVPLLYAGVIILAAYTIFVSFHFLFPLVLLMLLFLFLFTNKL